MRLFSFWAVFLGGPSLADFPETVNDHILPGHATFAKATTALADSAA